jgi:hypothetical protein
MQDKLTNNYYTELLNFSQFELDFEENADFPPFPDQFYWEEEVPEGEPDGSFMLHADMALAFDMEGYFDAKNGNVTCTLLPQQGKTTCPSSPLLPHVQEYASNNLKWVQDFREAYLKMVTTGCEAGTCTPIPHFMDLWLSLVV